jgi:hypothetical protein
MRYITNRVRVACAHDGIASFDTMACISHWSRWTFVCAECVCANARGLWIIFAAFILPIALLVLAIIALIVLFAVVAFIVLAVLISRSIQFC